MPSDPKRLPLSVGEAERLAGQVLLRVEYLESRHEDLRRLVLRTYRLVRELLAREDGPDVADLSILERAILDAAASGPLPAKRLAAKVGRGCNSHFRDQLRSLVRRGLLRQTPEGYCLPDG